MPIFRVTVSGGGQTSTNESVAHVALKTGEFLAIKGPPSAPPPTTEILHR